MIKTKLVTALRLAMSVLPIASMANATIATPVPQDPWEIAQREDCTEAYTRFVLENPDSEFVAEALCRIETLDALASNVTSEIAPAITAEMRGADSAARLMNI
jgi:hypothetical protein